LPIHKSAPQIRENVAMSFLRSALWITPFLLSLASLAAAEDFPLWEKLLQRNGANTDATPVPSMKMGHHMQMSLKATAQSGDAERAAQIVAAARRVIEHYADVDRALQDGYKPFFPSGKIGEEVHYTNYRYAQLERQKVDYDRPGSILYKRTTNGMQAVGVMYTARQDATALVLDGVAPLSVAIWHRHVDFCGWPRSASIAQRFGHEAQFGPQGAIHTEQACKDARGLWLPVVFGWMTHVYPNAEQPDNIWGGMDMAMEAADGSED
jgi:hypothetical protein